MTLFCQDSHGDTASIWTSCRICTSIVRSVNAGEQLPWVTWLLENMHRPTTQGTNTPAMMVSPFCQQGVEVWDMSTKVPRLGLLFELFTNYGYAAKSETSLPRSFLLLIFMPFTLHRLLSIRNTIYLTPVSCSSWGRPPQDRQWWTECFQLFFQDVWQSIYSGQAHTPKKTVPQAVMQEQKGFCCGTDAIKNATSDILLSTKPSCKS